MSAPPTPELIIPVYYHVYSFKIQFYGKSDHLLVLDNLTILFVFKQIPGNTTDFAADSLTPYSNYFFKVEMCNSVGCTASPNSQIYTTPQARKLQFKHMYVFPNITNRIQLVDSQVFRVHIEKQWSWTHDPGGILDFGLDGGVPPGPRDPNPCLE